MRLFQSHGTGVHSAVDLLLLIIATIGQRLLVPGNGEVTCGVPAATIDADVTQVSIISARCGGGNYGLFLIAATLVFTAHLGVGNGASATSFGAEKGVRVSQVNWTVFRVALQTGLSRCSLLADFAMRSETLLASFH